MAESASLKGDLDLIARASLDAALSAASLDQAEVRRVFWLINRVATEARRTIAEAQSAQAPHPPKGAWTPWGFMPAQPDFHAPANDQLNVPPSHPE